MIKLLTITEALQKETTGKGMQEWFQYFGADSTDKIGATDKFKAMLDHPDFSGATGYYFNSDGWLIVLGKGELWGWEEGGGNCVMHGTIFPLG